MELEDTEELLVLGSLLAQMTESERRWVRERIRELRQLVVLRREGRPPAARTGKRTSAGRHRT